MARIRLEQIKSNLTYDSINNILLMSGSLNATQTNPDIPVMIASGSLTVVDSLNVASGSLNISIIDGGTY
jgi:hypothetical protein